MYKIYLIEAYWDGEKIQWKLPHPEPLNYFSGSITTEMWQQHFNGVYYRTVDLSKYIQIISFQRAQYWFLLVKWIFKVNTPEKYIFVGINMIWAILLLGI